MMEVSQAKRLKEFEKQNARLKKIVPDREQLWTLSKARVVIDDWRRKFNEKHPHKSLRFETSRSFPMAASQASDAGKA